MSGKGERIIILGCGGRKGWVYYEVYKRTKKVVNSMEYKNDVSKYPMKTILSLHYQLIVYNFLQMLKVLLLIWKKYAKNYRKNPL